MDQKGGHNDLHNTVARIDEPPSGRLVIFLSLGFPATKITDIGRMLDPVSVEE